MMSTPTVVRFLRMAAYAHAVRAHDARVLRARYPRAQWRTCNESGLAQSDVVASTVLVLFLRPTARALRCCVSARPNTPT